MQEQNKDYSSKATNPAPLNDYELYDDAERGILLKALRAYQFTNDYESPGNPNEFVRTARLITVIENHEERKPRNKESSDAVVKIEDVNIDELFTEIELFLIRGALEDNLKGVRDPDNLTDAAKSVKALINVFADAIPALTTNEEPSAEPAEPLDEDEKDFRIRNANVLSAVHDLAKMARDGYNGALPVSSIGILIFADGGHVTRVQGGPGPVLIYGIAQQLILDTFATVKDNEAREAFEQMQAHVALANSSNLTPH